MPVWENQEEIVISGISGKFPESENVSELKKNLFEGVDMITEDGRRWKPGIYGTPKRMGKLKNIRKFDAQFFGVHGKQVDIMDPMQRIILENTYEAIFDAGYHPSTFRGSKIGVFIGCSDSSNAGSFTNDNLFSTYDVVGKARSFLANRISYAFDFKGPSVTLDAACSSTLHALNDAILAIRANQCEAAIVGGACINLSAKQTLSFNNLGVLSPDGICKVFDDTANGYSKSEAVGVVFLQTATNARRCYATVLNLKINNDGAKTEGITFPSATQQLQLYTEVFSDLKIDPSQVDYVEAHGTGTAAGDSVEGNTIGEFFCPGRNTPLLVGSIKSNLGHAEAASGVCELAKIILSMEEGVLPPNLHYSQANSAVPFLLDGRMQVVTQPTAWNPNIVAASNFGFGGSNAHLVLKANQIEKIGQTERKIARLVLASGRSEESVRYILQKVVEEQFTDEALVLLEEACRASTSGMSYRGFSLLQTPKYEYKPIIQNSSMERRPVWFLFSGMGSQWPGMAKDMMKLDVFANSILRSAQILKPYEIDLLHLLTDANEDEINNIVAAFVTIAAVQIGLVEVVKALEITPDGIVGHSVGELGCAYADGCFTAEQMLLAAYWRGKSSERAQLINGSMAAIGLSWEEIKSLCPEGVFPVCHNAEDSITISGRAEKVKEFVKELKERNVFARIINSCNIAFHCQYMKPASDGLRKELTKLIPNPIRRSSRWVSSSVPEKRWKEQEFQFSSANYMVNNLISPVLFNEAMTKVPQNAVIIEFAPHSLLQAIVKRIHGPSITYIGLMKKGNDNNLKHCLEGIGRMYTANLNPLVKNLYPKIRFPVSRGTNMLNSLIKWDHSIDAATFDFHEAENNKDLVIIDASKGSPEEYLTGHQVDGRVLFPFMGHVWLAWKALAQHLFLDIEEVPVVVEDFNVHRSSILPESGTFRFCVNYLHCDGQFRIVEGGSVLASGRIKQAESRTLITEDQGIDGGKENDFKDCVTLDARDFYKELRLRGYEYGSTFQGVLNAESNGLRGRINWEGRWITFMDSMLQIPILGMPHRALALPTRVKNIRIDPTKKPDILDEGVPFIFNPRTKVCKAGPIQIQGMHCSIAPRRVNTSSPVLEEYVFVPLYDPCILDDEEKQSLERYSQACSSLAQKILALNGKEKSEIYLILNSFEDNDESTLETYSKCESKEHGIFRFLKAVMDKSTNNSFPDNVTEMVTKYNAEIMNDVLVKTFLKERVLRSALDIVLDNILLSRATVTEISYNSIISKEVQKMVDKSTLGLISFEYTIARINDEPIPEGVLDSSFQIVNSKLNELSLPSSNDLMISSNIFTDTGCALLETLQLFSASVKNKGFILLTERTHISPAEKLISHLANKERRERSEEELEEGFQKAGLTIISKKKDNLTSLMYLLRKLPESLCKSTPQIIHMRCETDYSWVEELKLCLKEMEKNAEHTPVWIVSQSAFSGIAGLFNCLKLEPGGRNLRYLFLENVPRSDIPLQFDQSSKSFESIVKNDLMSNVIRSGQLGTFCHRTLDAEPSLVPRKSSFLNVTKRGDLSSFKWIESPVTFEICALDVNPRKTSLVQVYYAALNFKDVMLASGKLPPDALSGDLALKECLLGMEVVGRDELGRRVMGIVEAQGMSTAVRVPHSFLFPVPEQWTMEEASTVCIVYLTAYYALIIRGQMKKGESVLVHSGTGGVGQAAINIALAMGCRVFVTVGSDEKRSTLKNLFPEIKDSHISNSRTVNFEYDVMNATNGDGVDLVLNSLAEDKLHASVRCVKTHGRFLEIGKFDLAKDNALGMSLFLRNITFHGVHLDTLYSKSEEETFSKMGELLQQGIKEGVVKPLKRSLFNWNQPEEAFRFMASGKHTGKVVMKIRDEEKERISKPLPKWIPSQPRTYFDPRKSYIMTGGLGGFGLELTYWLVSRGARNIILSTRKGVCNDYQRSCIEKWRTFNDVSVRISRQDITSLEGSESLLEEAKDMGPVGGIFHLAMVLHDGLFENQTSEFFDQVCRPKLNALLLLDQLSRKHCSSLDHFVVFSSLSCGRGNPGQSNYGFANSAMERVVEKRKQDGFPGLAVQWGGIGEVGVVYERMGGNDVIFRGTIPQRLSSCLQTLDRFMQEDRAVVSSYVPSEKYGLSTDNNKDIKTLIYKVLGIKDSSTVKNGMTLGELGMDSIMGVEIKQLLESFNKVLTVPEVRLLSILDLEGIGNNKMLAAKPMKETFEQKTVFFNEVFFPKEVLSPLNNVGGSDCIFFVHPIEGHTNMLQHLAASLNKPVYGLQFTDKVPSTSIQEIAACYIQYLSKMQPRGPYHLAGFSYGCLIAYEMALQIQKTEHVRSLICIDGSPEVATEMIKVSFKEDGKGGFVPTPNSVQFFLKHCFGVQCKETEEAILKSPTGDLTSQILEIMKALNNDQLEEEIVVSNLERFKKLCLAAYSYKSSDMFKGKISLIKAKHHEIADSFQLSWKDDYGLRKIVDGSVDIFTTNSSHFELVFDRNNEISNIINEEVRERKKL